MTTCKTCLHVAVCAWAFMPQKNEGCEDYLGKDKLDQRKHGRWIPHRTGVIKRNSYYTCSECYTMGVQTWKSCPVCDTKMDLPNISDQTKKALETMGQKSHGGSNDG